MSLAQSAHLHLLLNHFPTIGTIIAVALFIVALIGKNDDLKRASLGIFLVLAILTMPVYMTGKAAQEAIKGRDGVSDMLMETHQDAALLAFLFMEITGAFAWLGLWQFRRISRMANWNLAVVLLFSIVTLGLMARAANMGGEIRHPEIVAQAAEPAYADTELIQAESIGKYISSKNWAWPALETLHFIGLSLLFGTVVVVNLRMLGVMKNVPFAALHRMLPWGVMGFGINFVSGMLFFVTVPGQYTQNIALDWKILLIIIGGINVLYFTLFDETWTLGPGDDAPLRAKFMASFTIFLWLGVMYFGRMMPFIGGSF